MTAALQANLVVRRGSFTLAVDVTLAPGETMAVLGRNGAGKSTLLSALAGLIRPVSGTVAVGGSVLTRRSVPGQTEVSIPPERRGIGLLGQQALLFPHLSALENVAFGRQAQGVRRRAALREAAEWLAAVGLAGLSGHKPNALSGGQQQRVAIARALAARPKVLLLDEPMAALDVQTASLIRELLRQRLADSGVAAILVTHDVLDAIVLADRVAIMHEGQIVDDGPKEQVLGVPRNQFVAALAGVNLVVGALDADGSVRLTDGRRLVGTPGLLQAVPGEDVSAVFRPSAVRVLGLVDVRDGLAGAETGVNVWAASIVALEPSTGGIRVRTDDVAGIVAELPPVAVVALGLAVGRRIRLQVDPAEVTIHPPHR